MRTFALLLAVAVTLAVAMQPLPKHGQRPVFPGWTQLNTAVVARNLPLTFRVNLGLFRRNMDAVHERFHTASDPQHKLYGNHFSAAELTELIAPTPDSIQQVMAYLNKHGVTNVLLATSLDSITFTAPAERIEALFNVNFAEYVNDKSGRRIMRALGDVHLPEELHSIVEVVSGFRSFPLPRSPRQLKKTLGDNTLITPAVIFKAYNVTFPAPQANNVQSFFQCQGQYVDDSDLASFCQQYFQGTNCKITKYVGPNQPSEPGIESALDSEYIMGTTKGLQETWSFSYSGDDFCGDLLQWGTDVLNLKNETHRPYVVSMSYGWQGYPGMCDASAVGRLSNDTMLMGSMGITVVIASGDDGSGQYYGHGSYYNNGLLNPSWPASIPYVLSVGSTEFIANGAGPEQATSEFGSGGGFSRDYNATLSGYQTAAIAAYLKSGVSLPDASTYNAAGRGTPDVAAFGWNFNVMDGGSWTGVGGTSASTPTFAGLISLLNNERMKSKGKTLGFVNPLFYQHPEVFTDVTTGTNAIAPATIGFQCTKGWDPITGLGTPKFGEMLKLVQKLNARDAARQF